MALGLYLFNFSPNDIVVIVSEIGLLCGSNRLTFTAFTTHASTVSITRIHRKIRSIRGDDGLGRDAHAAVVNRQLLAGQALWPRVAVLDEDGLTALPGPLAHRLAGLDGLVLEVNGADGRVHGTEEEEQVGAAVGAQQTFELLDGQDGVGLGAVVQVVGHLGHVPGQGLAKGDADGLTGCSPGSGHAEQAERGQGEQPGPQQQHPSQAAANHDPGRTGQDAAVPRTPRGPFRRLLLPPGTGHNDLGASPPPAISQLPWIKFPQWGPTSFDESSRRRPCRSGCSFPTSQPSRAAASIYSSLPLAEASDFTDNQMRGKQEKAREK